MRLKWLDFNLIFHTNENVQVLINELITPPVIVTSLMKSESNCESETLLVKSSTDTLIYKKWSHFEGLKKTNKSYFIPLERVQTIGFDSCSYTNYNIFVHFWKAHAELFFFLQIVNL